MAKKSLKALKKGDWIRFYGSDHLAEIFAELNRRKIGAVVDFSGRWILITQVPQKAQK